MLQSVRYIIVLTLLSAFSRTVPAAQIIEKEIAAFAASDQWLNALYYVQRNGHYTSLVVAPEFFADRVHGRESPLRELEAELALFREIRPATDANPQCLFPYRYQLLREKFELAPPVPCPAFETWKQSYEPKGLSLAYASQFISNPSSAFGHSFLLAESAKQPEALWLTYNYSAKMPNDVGVVRYAAGGILGWYSGEFSVLPFYGRLFEYGNVENRDLWIYPIRLSTSEKEAFLKHLWEVIHRAKFNYYFFDENCAGTLLRMLAAVLPEMGSATRLRIYVYPVEIFKALERARRLGAPRFVPSQFQVLREYVSHLSADEVRSFKRAIKNPDVGLPAASAELAQALMEYTSYRKLENGGELPNEFESLERSAYIARARHGASATSSATALARRDRLSRAPHLSHGPMATEFGASVIDGFGALDLGYRLSLHGQLDPDPGFLDYSAFEFLKVMGSATRDAVWLKELTFLNVETMQPLLTYAPKASWRVKLGLRENLLTRQQTDDYFEALLSYGAGFEVGSTLFYGLANGTLNIGRDLAQRPFIFGPELGILFRSGKIKSSAYVRAGITAFEYPNESSGGIGVSLSWQLGQNLNLIQENDWVVLADANQRGQRSSLHLRSHY